MIDDRILRVTERHRELLAEAAQVRLARAPAMAPPPELGLGGRLRTTWTAVVRRLAGAGSRLWDVDDRSTREGAS